MHRGQWRATPDTPPVAVAVKVQYPGVAKALQSDLRQLRRIARLLGHLGHLADATGLVDELAARLDEELDYEREAANQRLFASAFVDDPLIVVPAVHHATSKVLVTGWLEGAPLSTRVHDPELTRVERDRIGAALVHAIYAGPELTGLMHGDPHPGNFLLLGDGRLGVLDFGAVHRLPGGIPAPLGRNAALVLNGDEAALMETMTALGFLAPDAPVTVAEVIDYLAPMSEVFRAPTFTFTRRWLREEAVKLANPRSSSHAVAAHLRLPPEYLMLHRVALGLVGLLCQLEATVPLRAMELRWSPGFRDGMADHLGVDSSDLLAQAIAELALRHGAPAGPPHRPAGRKRAEALVAA